MRGESGLDLWPCQIRVVAFMFVFVTVFVKSRSVGCRSSSTETSSFNDPEAV